MKLLYFSSTGNCIYIAESLGGEMLSIPQLLKNNDFEMEDDVVGIIFPTYYAGLPDIVEEYLNQVKISSEYVFTICSYGSHPFGAERTLKKSNKILEERGIEVNYSNHVLMVDNFLPVFDMAQEKQIKTDSSIDEQIDIIKDDVANRRQSRIPTDISDEEILADKQRKMMIEKKFHLAVGDNECSECMICTQVCPRGNIRYKDGPLIGDNCEFCLACAHHCKQGVIRTNIQKSDDRFRNHHIKLSKIVKSNNVM